MASNCKWLVTLFLSFFGAFPGWWPPFSVCCCTSTETEERAFGRSNHHKTPTRSRPQSRAKTVWAVESPGSRGQKEQQTGPARHTNQQSSRNGGRAAAEPCRPLQTHPPRPLLPHLPRRHRAVISPRAPMRLLLPLTLPRMLTFATLLQLPAS